MRLLKLQYNYTLTKKVRLISAVLIALTWIVLILQSGLLENGSNLAYNREQLINSFLYDGFNIIKIVGVLYSMLLSIYVFYLNKYDVFIIPRKSRIKTILSKIAIVLFLEGLFILYLFLFYAIIWGVLDYTVTIDEVLKYLSYLTVLNIYYALFSILLIVLFTSIFSVVIPFIGYLISNLSMDYGISISELDTSSMFLNLFFPDLLIFNKEIYYIYGIVIVLDISMIILVLIIIKYKVEDIIT